MATADLSWLEFGPGSTAQLSWLEFAPPETTASVSWLEFSASAPSVTAAVSWLEFAAAALPATYTLTAETGAYTMTWAGSTGQMVLVAEVGNYTQIEYDAAMALVDNVFRLSATPIGKRLSLTMRQPNLSTRIR